MFFNPNSASVQHLIMKSLSIARLYRLLSADIKSLFISVMVTLGMSLKV